MNDDREETFYEVSWTVEVGAFDAADAASQAWGILSDAASGYGVATMLVVRHVDGDDRPRRVTLTGEEDASCT
jgi:hypothetical protein